MNNFSSVLNHRVPYLLLRPYIAVEHRNNRRCHDIIHLQKLCKEGTIDLDHTISDLDRSGAFFFEDKYYWRSAEAALNFQLQTEGVKACQFVDSELLFWQIPSAPVEEPEDDGDGLTEDEEEAYQGWFEDEEGDS